MKKYVFLLAPIVFVSCLQQSPKIVIKNKTTVTFDSIRVHTTPDIPTIFYDVSPKTVVKGKIFFDTKNTADGAYMIEIYNSGKNLKTQNFGYYTNGAPTNRKIEIEIFTDTIYFHYY
jgi:hypothetical protein